MDIIDELRDEITAASDRFEEAKKNLNDDDAKFQAGVLTGLRIALYKITEGQHWNEKIQNHKECYKNIKGSRKVCNLEIRSEKGKD